jgi:DNA repair exonuclease SbcCD ATPase subunit
MNDTLKQTNDYYKSLIVEKKLLVNDAKKKAFSLRVVGRKINDYSEARSVFAIMAKQVQIETTQHIEDLVTMAIQTVYEQPFTFHLLFEEKRNTISCTPIIKDGEDEYEPKHTMGGGVLDIIGFALRVVLWSMQEPRSRNIFILDEPFRYCGKLSIKAGQILKRLSEKLKFQVILVTHDDSLIDICDKVWIIEHRGFSRVSLIKTFSERIKRKLKRLKNG